MSSPPSPSSARYARSSPLARYLAVAYLALVVHASLYPFVGWRTPPESATAFVLADWPFYVTAADVVLNVMGYFPLGLLLTLVLMGRVRAGIAAVAGIAGGVAVSFTLELLQAWLPARIPSNVDLLSNGAGAAMGALVALLFGSRWLLSGELYRLRGRYFQPGTATDIGFLLLGAWLLTQLNAEIWLFGNGDLRHLVPGEVTVSYSAETYRYLEAGVAALNFAGVACMVTLMAYTGTAAAVTVAVVTGIALGLKSMASAALFIPGNAKLWLTPGSLAGLAAGVALWLLLSRLPRALLAAVAIVLLVLGTVLVNVAPENPYLIAALKVLQGGYYHGFNGLMRLLSTVWPFAVVIYLLFRVRRAGASVRSEDDTKIKDDAKIKDDIMDATATPVATPPDSLRALRDRLRVFAAERDWEQFHTPKNLAMSVAIEAAEVMEHFQWLTPAQSTSLTAAQRTEVAHEIADVLLYLIRLADMLEIDPVAAAHEKIGLNAIKYPPPRDL